jgi:uncharacterized protein YqeY
MILQEIRAAHKAARLARDGVTLTSLITLIGDLDALEKREKRNATDKEVVKALTKFAENAQQMADAYVIRGDNEKRDDSLREVELYKSFIPAAKEQLTDEALNRTIRSLIANRIATDCAKPKMGVIISDLKILHEGSYDPKAAAGVVKAELEATADPKID